MKYVDFMKQQEEGINALPLFFAFNNEQFEEEMKKLGLKPSDTDKIYSVPGVNGAFYPKDRASEVVAFFKDSTLSNLMRVYDFAYDAFYYEMGNHEYHINHYQGDWDVLSNFYDVEWLGDNADHMDYLNSIEGMTNTEKKAYLDARRKFLQDALDKGWY